MIPTSKTETKTARNGLKLPGIGLQSYGCHICFGILHHLSATSVEHIMAYSNPKRGCWLFMNCKVYIYILISSFHIFLQVTWWFIYYIDLESMWYMDVHGIAIVQKKTPAFFSPNSAPFIKGVWREAKISASRRFMHANSSRVLDSLAAGGAPDSQAVHPWTTVRYSSNSATSPALLSMG